MSDSNENYNTANISISIQKFLYCISIVYVVFGATFSTLSFLVFIRKKLNHKNMMGFYGILQAIIDMITHGLAFYYYFSLSIGEDKQLRSDVICKFKSFLVSWGAQLSSWLQVMITFDRILSVNFSNRFKQLRKRKFILMIILLIFVALAFINGINFFYYLKEVNVVNTAQTRLNTSIANASEELAETVCTSDATVVFIRDMVIILFRTVVPFIITFVLNLLLIRCLMSSKRKLKKTAANLHRERQFAFTIIALNVFFFLTQLPLGASLILLNIEQHAAISTNAMLINFAFYVSVYVGLLFNTFSFLVYLCFNKIFRKEFFLMLVSIKKKIV
jgi:hypothetical protein